MIAVFVKSPTPLKFKLFRKFSSWCHQIPINFIIFHLFLTPVMTCTSGLPEQKHFTLETVHEFSTYELRQELKQRGKFCVPDDYVNHEILLKTMIAILIDERDAAQSAALSQNPEADSGNMATLSKERAERKEAAIERSKQRLASAHYLEEKKRANEEFKNKTASKNVMSNVTDNKKNSSVKNDLDSKEFGLEEHPCDKNNNDPFAPKFRSKVGGRCFL